MKKLNKEELATLKFIKKRGKELGLDKKGGFWKDLWSSIVGKPSRVELIEYNTIASEFFNRIFK